MARTAKDIIRGIPLGPGWEQRWFAALDFELASLHADNADLLAACEEYVAILTMIVEHGYDVLLPFGDDGLHKARERARAAIAKARGGLDKPMSDNGPCET